MKRRVAALLMAVPAFASAQGGTLPHDSDMIFRAVLAHYAKELKNSPLVCVSPDASSAAFFNLRAGVGHPAFFPPVFDEPSLDRAFKAVMPREPTRVARNVLPRKFRLSSSDNCGDTVTLLAPAVVGELAFAQVSHSHVEGGAGGGTIKLIALRRKGQVWQVASVKTVLYIN